METETIKNRSKERYKMKIEKIGNRHRVKHEIGFYLYGNTKKEVLHKIAILENMKNKGGIK